MNKWHSGQDPWDSESEHFRWPKGDSITPEAIKEMLHRTGLDRAVDLNVDTESEEADSESLHGQLEAMANLDLNRD